MSLSSRIEAAQKKQPEQPKSPVAWVRLAQERKLPGKELTR